MSKIDIQLASKLFHERRVSAIAKRKSEKSYKRSGSNLMITFRSALGKIKADDPNREWCSLREVQALMAGA
jgi:hypothetical protein